MLHTIEGWFVCDIIHKQNAHSSSIVSCEIGEEKKRSEICFKINKMNCYSKHLGNYNTSSNNNKQLTIIPSFENIYDSVSKKQSVAHHHETWKDLHMVLHDSPISSFITLRVKATKARPGSGLAVVVCTCWTFGLRQLSVYASRVICIRFKVQAWPLEPCSFSPSISSS